MNSEVPPSKDSSGPEQITCDGESPFLAPSSLIEDAGPVVLPTLYGIRRGFLYGTVAFVFFAVFLNEYIFRIQIAVLGVDNQYEIDLHPWKLPLTICIWLLFIAVAILMNICLARYFRQ